MKNRLLAVLLLAGCLLGLLSGCANKEKRVVGSCAGYDVLYEELRFVALSVREKADNADSAELAEAVALQIAEDYAVLIAAKTYFPDLSLESDEIQKAVDDEIDAKIEEYGSKSKFKSFLKENNLTEHYARLMLARAEVELKWEEQFRQELFQNSYLESETTFAAWLEDGNLVRARRVVSESETELAEIRAGLIAGKSVEEAVGDRNANLSAKFYLVRGYLEDEELEADAFALSAQNPVGSIRQTAAGYRMLVWEEIDMDSFSAYQLPTYLAKMQDAEYETERKTVLLETASENRFVFNEFGASIDLTTIK